jgi:hypothetical protein
VRSDVSRIWVARVLIGLILLINVQSALVFWLDPGLFAPAYELSGIPGEAAIRGFAILFLMWNVPYGVALINPVKHRVSLYEAIAMQGIGLIGESLILWGLPEKYIILRESIWRFVLFDGAGLVVLVIAALIIWKTKTWKDAETFQV